LEARCGVGGSGLLCAGDGGVERSYAVGVGMVLVMWDWSRAHAAALAPRIFL
jgi:hypothetical protein